MDFLQAQIGARPELAPHYSQLEDLFRRRLWHQLTLKLEEFFNSGTVQGEALSQLYLNFVTVIHDKINPLKSAQFAVFVSNHFTDPEAAQQFLQAEQKRIEDREGSLLLLRIQSGRLKLRQYLVVTNGGGVANPADEALVTDTKALIDELRSTLEGNAAVDHVVQSSFYRLALEYHKIKGTAVDYYKNALMYLSYTPLEQLSLQERQQIASDLALAAFVGDSVYNFGELLSNPILDSLQNTEFHWLKELLYVFNNGKIEQFEQLYATNKDKFDAQPVLAHNLHFLREKIRMMCLMELVFNRASDDRSIPFEAIADETKLPIDKVELLLMKSMSLKLIKGVIDEIDQVVRVSWVQPRVLDKQQIRTMSHHLEQWTKQVHDTWKNISPDLMA